jgi:hypothetical protein
LMQTPFSRIASNCALPFAGKTCDFVSILAADVNLRESTGVFHCLLIAISSHKSHTYR